MQKFKKGGITNKAAIFEQNNKAHRHPAIFNVVAT